MRCIKRENIIAVARVIKTIYVMNKRELLFKFLVVGDYGVGKTSIVRRYAEDTFSSTYKITIGADFALKRIEWDERTIVNLQLWDIAGHERFGTLTRVYYRYALAAAVVFDLTRPNTFESVIKWIKDLREKVDLTDGSHLPIILLANKGDVAVENVDKAMLDRFCIQHRIITWLITSAKENINLEESMKILLDASFSNSKQRETQSEIVLPGVDGSNHTKTKWFCTIL